MKLTTPEFNLIFASYRIYYNFYRKIEINKIIVNYKLDK